METPDKAGNASRAMASTQLQPHLLSFIELADSENAYLQKLRFYQEQLTILCNKGYVKNKLKFKEKLFWAYFACHDLIPYTEYLVQQLTLRKERALLGGEDVRLFDMDWQLERMRLYEKIILHHEPCRTELTTELITNKQLSAHAKEIEKAYHARFGEKLTNVWSEIMSLPPVHVMRYMLPITGLVKQLPEGHPDKVAAKQLLDNLDRVVRQANTFQKTVETAEEMMRLRTSIQGLQLESRMLTVHDPIVTRLQCKAYFKDHIVDEDLMSENTEEAQQELQQEVFRNARDKCKTPVLLLLLNSHVVILKEKDNPTPAHKWRLIEAIELANVVFGDRLEVTRTPTPARDSIKKAMLMRQHSRHKLVVNGVFVITQRNVASEMYTFYCSEEGEFERFRATLLNHAKSFWGSQQSLGGSLSSLPEAADALSGAGSAETLAFAPSLGAYSPKRSKSIKSITSIGSQSVLDGEYVSNAMAMADVVAGRAYHKQMQQEAVRHRGSEQEPTSFMSQLGGMLRRDNSKPREPGSPSAGSRGTAASPSRSPSPSQSRKSRNGQGSGAGQGQGQGQGTPPASPGSIQGMRKRFQAQRRRLNMPEFPGSRRESAIITDDHMEQPGSEPMFVFDEGVMDDKPKPAALADVLSGNSKVSTASARSRRNRRRSITENDVPAQLRAGRPGVNMGAGGVAASPHGSFRASYLSQSLTLDQGSLDAAMHRVREGSKRSLLAAADAPDRYYVQSRPGTKEAGDAVGVKHVITRRPSSHAASDPRRTTTYPAYAEEEINAETAMRLAEQLKAHVQATVLDTLFGGNPDIEVSNIRFSYAGSKDLSRPTTPAAGGHPAVAKSVGDEVLGRPRTPSFELNRLISKDSLLAPETHGRRRAGSFTGSNNGIKCQDHSIHDSAGSDIGNTAVKEVPAITGRLADLSMAGAE